MTIKADHWIVKQAREKGMIEPFQESQVARGRISSGVSSYGYDFRIDREFKLFRGSAGDLVDPKAIREDLFTTLEADSCDLPGGSYLLAKSLEYFRIPRNILALCTGKSTYARCGIVVNVTPLEPEWEGFLTVSIANSSPASVRLYAGEGIGQLIFLESNDPCRTSYSDRKGKYQKQQQIELSRIQRDSEVE